MLIQPHFLNEEGATYQDFIVTKYNPIIELNCILREITHLPTGAQIMHIGNDDPENLFCLSFKTLPASSDGAAHILEHTVLCGSKKFPIKDPFFSMNRRSLNTFMNALTGSDFTCYPAASQVEKDFYNLLDVYIDAVFHPQLKKLSFLQEGHRLEFSSPKNPKSPLEFKGIVFNEMKGALASSESRMWHTLMEELVPDLPYAFNSGGDPKEIPNLTYENLIRFHEIYYHPSRCLFFFYGNFPLKKNLDFIAENALKNVLKEAPLPPIKLQPRFLTPVKKEISYPITASEDLKDQTIISFCWLTVPLIDQEDVLALNVIDSILMDSDASLLKRQLLDSPLCLQADAMMDTDMSEIPYAIVFKGCKPDSADQLELLIKHSLEKIISQPIPSHLIDAAIHQQELSRLEIGGDQSPFGLTLFMRSALAKQHGCNPENMLMIHSLFESLLKKVEDPTYLPNLIKKCFLDNPHYIRLIMNPDPDLSSKEITEEKQMLQRIQDQLDSPSIEHILKQTQELNAFQKQADEQCLDCLPKVTLDDVTPLVRYFSLDQSEKNNLKIFHHECFTNHILYADLIFDLPSITDEDLPYVQLLISLLPEIGCGNRNYIENLEYAQEHTGGIGASCSLHIQADDPHVAKPSLSIRGKGVYRKADHLFALLYDTVTNPHYHEAARIKELLLQMRTSMQQRLNKLGMRYAIQLSLSGSSTTNYIAEAWNGLRYFKMIESITRDIDQNLPKVINKLIALKESIFSFQNPHLVLSCCKKMMTKLQENNFYKLSTLTIKPFTPWQDNYIISPVQSHARAFSSQLAFSAESFKTVPYSHIAAPALTVATLLFENKILHQRIREQGGAYGSGASYSSTTGNFYFHSYRDPKIAATWTIFHEAIDCIAKGHFTEQDLEEAKLGIIQQFDMPTFPGSRAITAYGWWRDGKTKEMRQHFRDRLLSLTIKDVQHAVETELLPQKNKSVFVCFAGKELLEKENLLLKAKQLELPILPI